MTIVGRLLVCVLILSACGDLDGSRVGRSLASATPDSRFGFAVSQPDGLSVTPEPGKAWQAFPDNASDAHGGAPSVSPDGRLVAYWYGRGKYGPDRPQELRVRNLVQGTTVTVFREDPIRPASGGGRIAWASDSAGLVFADPDSVFEHRRGLIASTGAFLWLTDTNGATPRRLTIPDAGGRAVTPIGWDRRARVIAAVQANTAFAVHEDGRVERHALRPDAAALATKTAWSPSHRMASSIELIPCSSGSTCTQLRVWRIDDPRTANVYMPRGDEAVMDTTFLPGTKDMLVLLRKDTDARLERWADFGGGPRRTLHSFTYGWDLAVRADGTAAIITSLGRYFPTPPPAYLVDPHTGQVTILDLAAAPYSAGLVSVRLR